YLDTTLQLTLDPSRQTASFLDNQLKGLRDSLEQAQARLSEYQQKYGIVASDEKLDIEKARLGGQASLYTQVEAEVSDSTAHQKNCARFAAGVGTPEEVPDVLSSPLIQSIKSELMRAEAKLKETSATLGTNHPQVKRQLSEIDELRRKLDQEIKYTVG